MDLEGWLYVFYPFLFMLAVVLVGAAVYSGWRALGRIAKRGEPRNRWIGAWALWWIAEWRIVWATLLLACYVVLMLWEGCNAPVVERDWEEEGDPYSPWGR